MTRHAVTVVVFGSEEHLVRRTIHSTLRQTRPPDLFLVLVSGSEPDGPMAKAVTDACSEASSETWCQVVARPDNLGFAGGHNFLTGAAFGQGADWVTLLNPDLELEVRAFEDYWTSVEQHAQDFAVHGPQLVSGHGEGQTIDSAGIMWTRDARHFDADQGRPARFLSDRVVETEGVSGAVLTVSRGSYSRLVASGGEFLDDMFLAYREDAELGRRVQVMGGRCLIHPARGFLHERGARNAERTSTLQRCLGVQNRFLLKSRLGENRPGGAVRALGRDLLVVAAVCLWERSSLPGLRRAWAVRRFERYKGLATKPAAPAVTRGGGKANSGWVSSRS